MVSACAWAAKAQTKTVRKVVDKRGDKNRTSIINYSSLQTARAAKAVLYHISHIDVSATTADGIEPAFIEAISVVKASFALVRGL